MKVSIVVPVYNIADCISYCAESLACQDYENIEIILVDDGSTDDSPSICDTLANSYDRIKVIHKQNGGLSSARNAGIDAALGEYILFIDGDDYLDKGAISTLVSIAENTHADVVQYGYEEVFGYMGLEQAKQNNTPDYIVENVDLVTDRHEFFKRLYDLGGVCASGCTKLMRIDLARSLRYKEGILHEDEQFTTRLLSSCHSIAYITDFTPYKYVMREGSIIHASFKAKRLYDSSNIFEERLAYLEQLGYTDLVSVAASRYYCNMMMYYLMARKAGDVKAYEFIDQKVKQILSNYSLELHGFMKFTSLMYKVGLSGGNIKYKIKHILGK